MIYTFADYEKKVFERNPHIKELCEQEMLKYIIAERIKRTREQK
jgi:hypothetical protein